MQGKIIKKKIKLQCRKHICLRCDRYYIAKGRYSKFCPDCNTSKNQSHNYSQPEKTSQCSADLIAKRDDVDLPLTKSINM